MVKVRRCCVPGCQNRSAKWYNFPSNKEICAIWLDRIGNMKLQNNSTLKNYRICGEHFHDSRIGPDQKLLRYSLPSLLLPGFKGSVTENSYSFPIPTGKSRNPQTVTSAIEIMATNLNESEDLQVMIPSRTYSRYVNELSPNQRGSDRNPQFEVPINAMESADIPSTSATIVMDRETSKNIQTQVLRRKYRSKTSHTNKLLVHQLQLLRRSAKKNKSATTTEKLQLFQNNDRLIKYFKTASPLTVQFFHSQLQNSEYGPRGKRYTKKDKILALSIYKQSGKAYKFLSKIFSLPSPKLLSQFLNRTTLLCGLNSSVFEGIKQMTVRMKTCEKYCILMWDEIFLQANLQYNSKYNFIEGFVDMGGSNRKMAFADHALVFMVKSLKQKWKQPVWFSFCEGSTSAADLVRIIKEVVVNIRAAGLIVVASVCDQGSTNQSAVNKLIGDTSAFCLRNNIENIYAGYLINEIEIVHLYDYPHLLKGIRNGLLSKNLHFVQDGQQKVAKWSHILDLYNMDKQQGPFSQIYKLTDEHVVPNKIKKMKVSCCTQVFSRTVSSAMYTRASVSSELPSKSLFYLDPLATETADLLLFLNNLFDSCNGTKKFPPKGQEVTGVVTNNSGHISSWNNSISILQTMFFSSPDSNEKKVIPSIKNWIFTLKSFKYLHDVILKKYKLKFFSGRAFNQDPIENFFSQIRQHSARTPTCTSFRTSYVTLLINNLTSPKSISSNCEDDISSGTLMAVEQFLQQNVFNFPNISSTVIPAAEAPTEQVTDLATPYVAGAISKKFFKFVSCVTCQGLLITSETLPEHSFISLKQFSNSNLLYPSQKFTQFIKFKTLEILSLLPKVACHYNLKSVLITEVSKTIATEILCDEHKSKIKILLGITINVVVFNYLKKINNILHGKNSKTADLELDYLTKIAFIKYNKTKKHKVKE